MKTTTFKNNWLTAAALLLSLPTAYFILISVLKYWLGVSGPFDTAQPALERWGIKDAPGWNINLLILFGPVLAFLLTLFQILKIEWRFTEEEFLLNFTVHKRWFPLLVTAFSVGLMAILTFYFLVENYRHGCE